MSNLTSNGQVTSRDIRQQAVKTLHILDEAVTTAKIPDLAVTFPDKIDNPIWSQTFRGGTFQNETITTTPTTFGDDAVIVVPAWVDQLSVFAVGNFQLTNTSGGDVLMAAGLEIDGEVLGGYSHEAVNNQTQVLTAFRVANLAGVGGASIAVVMECSISTGTNTSNLGRVAGIAVGTR